MESGISPLHSCSFTHREPWFPNTAYMNYSKGSWKQKSRPRGREYYPGPSERDDSLSKTTFSPLFMNRCVGHKSKHIICIKISNSVTNLSSQMDTKTKGGICLKLINTHTNTILWFEKIKERDKQWGNITNILILYGVVLNTSSTVASSCGGDSLLGSQKSLWSN